MIDLSQFHIWTEEEFRLAFPPAPSNSVKPNGAGSPTGAQGGGIVGGVAQPAEPDEINEADLTDDLREWVQGGVPEGEDRSVVFFKVVKALKRLGYSAAAIFDLLEHYPDGIAQKYLDESASGSPARLQREVERAYDKPPKTPPAVPATKAKTKTGSQWPDPEPLEGSLPAVDAFDLELLPESIRSWIEDIAEQMQCPVDYLGVTAIIGLGSALGRKIAIRPNHSGEWFEVPNLWGMVVGPPGWMKSPAMNAALKPLRRLEERARAQGEFGRADYERQVKIYKQRIAAAESIVARLLKNDPNAEIPEMHVNMLPPALQPPRKYILINGTYEKIGEHAALNPLGFLIHRDEIMSLLRYLAQEDHSEARGFYLEAWAGNSTYDFSRIGRGEIQIPHLSFSLLGSTQPGVLSSFVAEASRDESNDGMLQRFGMMVWPDGAEDFEFIDQPINAAARDRAYAMFERLDQLTAADAHAQRSMACDIPWLPLATDAYQAFKTWRIEFEYELRSGKIGSPALEAHLAKYRKLIPVLALIRHLADGGDGPVTLRALESAFAWQRYLESHARRIYGSTGDAEMRAAKAIIERIKNGGLSAPFLARELIRKHWIGLTDAVVVKNALDTLVDTHWLFSQVEKTGGRPLERYIINPKAK